MDKAHLRILTVMYIKEDLKMICFMDKESINARTVINRRVIGKMGKKLTKPN